MLTVVGCVVNFLFSTEQQLWHNNVRELLINTREWIQVPSFKIYQKVPSFKHWLNVHPNPSVLVIVSKVELLIEAFFLLK